MEKKAPNFMMALIEKQEEIIRARKADLKKIRMLLDKMVDF
jgi:hypothetical protein